MQFTPLLVTLLAAAPSGAMAFERLDCVGIEYCLEGVCGPSFLTYVISFDWTDDSATLPPNVGASVLHLQSTNATPDLSSGDLVYVERGAPDAPVLMVGLDPPEITAMFSLGRNEATHRAICAPQGTA